MSGQMIIEPSKCPECGEMCLFPGKEPHTTVLRCIACGYEEELDKR